MNRRKVRLLISLIFFSFLLSLVSCGNRLPVLSETDHTHIYASVIKQMFIDYSPRTKAGYIMTSTDDNAGIESGKLNSVLIPESLQRTILTELRDSLLICEWVDFGVDISDAVFSGSSCQIVLGNIQLQNDGSVQVTASLFYGGTGGGGTTYILKNINGVWTVSGKTGRSWMS